MTLVDYGREGPAIAPGTGITQLEGTYFTLWSSTTLHGTGSAWYIDGWNGATGMNFKSDPHSIVCVCGGH